jgi:hydrogenase maturation protein HypF
MNTRIQLQVRGVVQGVGFRPFIYSLARQEELKGKVRNTTSGVLIDVEGEPRSIETFITNIRLHPPANARIDSIDVSPATEAARYEEFRIAESENGLFRSLSIVPDLATCRDCLREMADPKDRRYRYPFINCTKCGPRFTIIEGSPYDRAQTTMHSFEMCADCRAEYLNPLDRRFHAEATCCPRCGPTLSGTSVERAQELIAKGGIAAVKGIGGFHLVCDAMNDEAVRTLRNRKRRDGRPFALMAARIEIIQRFCLVSSVEAELLSSAACPIVLLERRNDCRISDAVAPAINTLGFMLPYSPLHHLLLEGLETPLVMTSGNVSQEPLCFDNEDAVRRLAEIAESFVFHDRKIRIRTDDSVVRNTSEGAFVIRRARGFATNPVKVSVHFPRAVLACGAELKSTFCLAREYQAFVSHHIGDLENMETFRSFTSSIEHFQRLFDIRPEIVAYDLHPDYLSSKYALSLDSVPLKVGVQHHHAHAASCMAENQLDGDVIGFAFDGIGYGTDGKLWGGECFVANFKSAHRVAHLDYVPLPGGNQAIREPWRMGLIYLRSAFGDGFTELPLPFLDGLPPAAAKVVLQMAEMGIQSPKTSSMGRLFDAVSALIGLRGRVHYEGQAAIELEAVSDFSVQTAYEFDFSGTRVRSEPLIRQIVEDIIAGVPVSTIAAQFHNGVAQLVESLSLRVRCERDLTRVVLSGGVFQNRFLLERTSMKLRTAGFDVYKHKQIPPNDGGICLGQAMIANARAKAGEI